MNTKIAELIGETTENFKSALEIEKGLTQAKINFKINFWQDLLEELGNDFKFSSKYKSLEEKHENIEKSCKNYYTGTRDNTEQGIIYELKDVRISLVAHHNLCFNLDALESQKWYKKCSNKEEVLNTKKGKFFPKNIRLNFKKLKDTTIDLLSDENRQTTIKNLANEFKDIIEQLEK
jgi:predicted transcriptional regulator